MEWKSEGVMGKPPKLTFNIQDQVLWTVCAHRRMWSVTNYFLLNLTLSDILMATLNTTFSFIYMKDRWRIFVFIFVITTRLANLWYHDL